MNLKSEQRNWLAAAAVFVVVVLVAAGGRADASLTAAVERRPGGVAVSRSSAADLSTSPPAFAVGRRGGGVPESCLPGNCVSNEAELIDAIENISVTGGVITLCRDAPIVLEREINLFAASVEVTIECCDVQRRTSGASLPACSIVTGPDCQVIAFTGTIVRNCGFSFFFASVTLSGILFDGSSNGSPVEPLDGGIVEFLYNPTFAPESRLSVVDCVFRNVEGGVRDLPQGAVQLRALNIIAGVAEDVPGSSFTIEVLRTGFFDNPSGGLLLLPLSEGTGFNGNTNAFVRDCQFERNGQSSDFLRGNDNSGVAVLGPIASITVESSRFIDNVSRTRGAAIQIERNFDFGAPAPNQTDSTSVTLRDNLFRGNRFGKTQFFEAGAVFIRLEGVIAGSVTIEDSDFIDNAAFDCDLPGSGCTEALGGGLCLNFVTEEVIIDRCRFKNNVANAGAAFSAFQVGSLVLSRSKIEKNEGRGTDGVQNAVNIINVPIPVLGFNTFSVSQSTFKKNIGTHTSVALHR